MKASSGNSAAFFSALGIAVLVVSTHSSRPNTARAARLQQPGLPLSVMFDGSNLDPDTKQLYQAMQNSIDGFAITPADRPTYYSAVYNVNGYVVNGWQGIITTVQANANGNLVSIDVIPGLSSDAAPSAMIVDSDYSERYQVFPDGTFQFVGAYYAAGSSGQMPTIIGL